MKKFIIILLSMLFLATSCQMFKTKPTIKELDVQDRYLTQEEMTELVTYVYTNGTKSEEPDGYSISSYEMILEKDGEMITKAALVFVYNIQEKFHFADETATESPFLMLVVVNKPTFTEHNDGDGGLVAVQADVVYEFYGSGYNEEKDVYPVKPNKMFKKMITYETTTGVVVNQEVTDTREDNPEGHDCDEWKAWLGMFYEKMQVDKENVDEPS